jgi:hypothetical protein
MILDCVTERCRAVSEVKIIRFRNARNLSKLFPERFKLLCKVIDLHVLWCLYERKDYSKSWQLVEESHEGLVLLGWNRLINNVHFSNKIAEFINFPKELSYD